MALDAVNSTPPRNKKRPFDDVSPRLVVDSWRKSRRSKRQRLSQSEDEYLAVCLLMLARSGGGPHPSTSAVKTSQSSVEVKTVASVKESPCAEIPKWIPVVKPSGNPVIQETVIPVATAPPEAADFEKLKDSVVIGPPEAEVEKLKDSVIPTTPPQAAVANSYKCFCGKAFSSHQALGGHKASHRTKPPTALEFASVKDSPYAVLPDCLPAVKPSGRLHECGTCHQSFTSGQALGGHKRKHFEGITANGTAKTQMIASTNGASSRDRIAGGAVIHDFDLNIAPPEEE